MIEENIEVKSLGRKGKYEKWLKEDSLEQLANWAAKGCTYAEMSNNMGINERTLYDWVDRFPQISQAIEKGRQMSVVAIENAFFRRALGGEVVEETIEEFKGTFKNGKPENGTGTKRTVKKKLPSDVTAMVFYLKNRAGYRSEPPQETSSEMLAKVDELLDALGDA